MRRTVLGLAAGMIAALLCVTPAVADETSPQTRVRSDGSQTYDDPSLTSQPTTQVEGVLRKVVADNVKGSTESTVIVTDDSTVIPVDFDAAIASTDVPVTAELVDGSKLDAALDGKSTAPVEVASAIVEGPVASAGGITHNAYVVIVTDTGPVNATAIENGIDAGLDYWKTEAGASIPTFNRAGGTKLLNSAYTGAKRCGVSDPWSLWHEAKGKFAAGTFDASGNHLIVVVSDACANYGVGIGTVGSSINSGGLTVMTTDPAVFKSTLVHELGHNFGLAHANFQAPTCAAPYEYWNLFSVLGLAVSYLPAFEPPSLDSAYRDQLGITDAGETGAVGDGDSVTTVISPRGATSGLRGIEVLVGGTSYWIDYRNGSGRDTSTFYAAANGSSIGGRSYPDGVTVTRQATDSDAPTALMARTATVGSYGLGQSFAVGDIVVTVNSLGSTANVTISHGSPLPPIPTDTPTVSGTVRVGKAVTANPGTWPVGTQLTYQWTSNGVNIPCASAQSYTISGAFVGTQLAVKVTGVQKDFAPTTSTSDSVNVAVGVLTAPYRPKISGTAKVGKTLTASQTGWTSGTTRRYRWLANGKPITSFSTKRTYKIKKSMKGKYITVQVNGRKTGYTSVTKTSAKTKMVKKK